MATRRSSGTVPTDENGGVTACSANVGANRSWNKVCLWEALWSALLLALREHPEATASSLISYGAIDWANHAVSSPVGKLAQALMKDEGLESSAGGFPRQWLYKVESLLGMAGDARRDALVIFPTSSSGFTVMRPTGAKHTS
jgi:hypothetical protein